MKTLTLRILSMGGVLLETETDSVVLAAPDGEFGVMAGHVPAAATLPAGQVRYRAGGEFRTYPIDGGLCEVRDDVITILV